MENNTFEPPSEKRVRLDLRFVSCFLRECPSLSRPQDGGRFISIFMAGA